MSAEVLRESGSPVPAQRATRLPYETPPLQILVDPSDPNIDLGTQLGFGENTFFSSRLKPGRLMPTDLGISHHVLDYRMDQMAQEPERLAEQPIPSSLLQRAGETLRKIAPPALIPATALGAAGAAVITIVQPQVPSAEASGFKIEPGAINTTAECVEDNLNLDNPFSDNPDDKRPFIVETSDPDYARKIASGEITIKIGKPPIAALEEGAETAVITGTPVEEVLKNLIIPAPKCKPPSVPVMHRAQELIETKDVKGITRNKLAQDIETAYRNNTHPEVTDKVLQEESSKKGRESAKGDLDLCTTPNRRQIQTCVELLDGALYVHMLTNDPNFWNIVLDVKNYYIEKWPSKKGQLYAHLDQAFPPDVIFTLDDF